MPASRLRIAFAVIAGVAIGAVATFLWRGSRVQFRSNQDLFQIRHPVEASSYTQLHEISIGSVEIHYEELSRSVLGIADIVERYKEQPEKLEGYIGVWRTSFQVPPSISTEDWWLDIKTNLTPSDTLYHYRSADGNGGTLIIRDGMIVYRRPIVLEQGDPEVYDSR